MAGVFFLTFLITIMFIVTIMRHNIPTFSNWKDIAVTYVILFVILIFHEFGHAAASMKMSVKPKEIGVGFYLIFPVLYTNVTNIWVLKKNKRIIINIAGIYFQNIANVLLIMIYLFYPNDICLRIISITVPLKSKNVL